MSTAASKYDKMVIPPKANIERIQETTSRYEALPYVLNLLFLRTKSILCPLALCSKALVFGQKCRQLL